MSGRPYITILPNPALMDELPDTANAPAVENEGEAEDDEQTPAQGALGEAPAGLEEKLEGRGRVINTTDPSKPSRTANCIIFLTFSALYTDELTQKQAVIDAMQQKKPELVLKFYCLGREKHTEPADVNRPDHVHIVLEYPSQLRTTNRAFFNLRGRGDRVLIPYVLGVGNTQADILNVRQYVLKDGDILARLPPGFEVFDRDAVEQPWAVRVRDECDSTQTALSLLLKEYPYEFLTLGTRIKPMLALMFPECADPKYERTDFITWFDLPALHTSGKVLVLTGKSGTGKTELAIALEPRGKTLLVRDTDDLRRLSPAHTKIVFDDFNLSTWSPEDAIHLLDVAHATSVRCRYETVRIQPWVARVFTSNLSVDDMFPRGSYEHITAMRRRMKIVNVTECLFTQPEQSSDIVMPGTGAPQRRRYA